MDDFLRHNPYVGSFHSVYRTDKQEGDCVLWSQRTSPHVGTFRHSPADPKRLKLGLKALLYEKVPWKAVTKSQVNLAREKMCGSLICGAVRIYREGSMQCSEPKCAICLDNYVDACELRLLKCGHSFHRNCVDTWFLQHYSGISFGTPTCPTCRESAEGAVAVGDGDTEASAAAAAAAAPVSSSSTASASVPQTEFSDAAFMDIGMYLLAATGLFNSAAPTALSPRSQVSLVDAVAEAAPPSSQSQDSDDFEIVDADEALDGSGYLVC